jgi:hypothetical protein
MKLLSYIFFFIVILNKGFCQETHPKKVKETTVVNIDNSKNDSQNNQDIKIKVFKLAQGWGFDILWNKKKYIHQTNIPAINGNIAFKTKKDALKIAKLMKSKICNNIIPPSISLQEINNLISIN